MIEDWVGCQLGEILRVSSGKGLTTKKMDGGKYPVYGGNGITGYHSAKIFDEKKLIIGRVGVRCGVTHITKNESWVTDNALVVSFNKPYFDIKFMQLKLQFENLNKLSNSTAQPVISGTKIYSYKIIFPPLPIQRAIVSKIESLFSSLDSGIADLKKAQAQLKIYRQAVLKKAFEGELTKEWREQQADLPSAEELLEHIKGERQKHYENKVEEWVYKIKFWEENGKEGKKPTKPRPYKKNENISEVELIGKVGFHYVRLGEFIGSIQAGKSHRCDERPPCNGEFGIAKVSAVSWNEYDEQESKTCMDHSQMVEGYIIKPGDFLFSRANTIELVGACVIVKATSLKIMLSDKTLRLNFTYGIYNFFLYYLRSIYGRKEIESRSTGNQDSMRNIGQERIRKILIPLFSSIEQQQIVKEIESRLSVCDKVEKDIKDSLEKATALRQSILKKAFEGKLLTKAEIEKCKQESDYEPASVLLERIKKEKK